MGHMIVNVIGMALFIGIYAYALSTEPLGGDEGPRPTRRRAVAPPVGRRRAAHAGLAA